MPITISQQDYYTCRGTTTVAMQEVPGYWIGAGPIAANLVLDDLFKYLVPQYKSNN